jgi:hypothetical protein
MRRFLIEQRYRFENSQASTAGTLGIIFVRLGIAEVGHHAITLILNDLTAEPSYGVGCGFDDMKRRPRDFLRGRAW